VFDVKEGWEPLYQFLDVPVPSVPFPHRNDSAQIKAIIEAARHGLLKFGTPEAVQTALRAFARGRLSGLSPEALQTLAADEIGGPRSDRDIHGESQ
jgi:Sulfotransferase domain